MRQLRSTDQCGTRKATKWRRMDSGILKIEMSSFTLYKNRYTAKAWKTANGSTLNRKSTGRCRYRPIEISFDPGSHFSDLVVTTSKSVPYMW
jgi:hypothetical protein